MSEDVWSARDTTPTAMWPGEWTASSAATVAHASSCVRPSLTAAITSRDGW